MSYTPRSQQIKGAFGESIVAQKTPLVQISNKYQIDPSLINILENFSATGGTVDNNGNLFRCQTGTSVGGYGVIRSKTAVNYSAGEGIEASFTAKFTTGIPLSLQFGGLFSLTETVAFGYDGADFSCLHSYGGVAEVQKIEITVTGAGTCNVTLDGVAAAGITVTSSTVQTNAEEIRAALANDAAVNGAWRFEQIDNSVYCIARNVGNKTGSFTITGGVTATITERTSGVLKTDAHTSQTNWNRTTSPFAGFDPTKMNVYKVRYGYLGAANIDFFVYDSSRGEFILVHSIEWANNNSITHLGHPDLKIGWTAASLGASGTNLTVEGASGSIEIEGLDRVENDTHAIEAIQPAVGLSLVNVATVKSRIVFADRFNLGRVRPLRVSIDNDHTKGLLVEIYKNATIGGTQNFQLVDEFNNLVAYDTLGTTVTGGDLVDGVAVPANGSVSVNLDEITPLLLPEDTLTIAAKTASGTGASVTAIFTWREDK
jgi:hypothetical protein